MVITPQITKIQLHIMGFCCFMVLLLLLLLQPFLLLLLIIMFGKVLRKYLITTTFSATTSTTTADTLTNTLNTVIIAKCTLSFHSWISVLKFNKQSQGTTCPNNQYTHTDTRMKTLYIMCTIPVMILSWGFWLESLHNNSYFLNWHLLTCSSNIDKTKQTCHAVDEVIVI